MSLPQPSPNDRAAFIGPTGSGKTVLARAMLKAVPNVIVIDPKHQFSWDEFSPRYSRIAHDVRGLGAHLQEIEAKASGEPVIYRPPATDFLPKNLARVDAVFGIALARGNTTIFVDEMSYLTGSSVGFQERIPNWFRAVTTGRQRGVGVWSAFQRPSNVPLLAMSESDYRVVYYLRMAKDQARAEELCGPIDWDALAGEPYSFVWATDRFSSQPTRLQLHSHPVALEAATA